MKKIILLLFICVLYSFETMAQKELWGTVSNGGQYGFGYIYKTDSAGNNLVIKYSFDDLKGKFPAGKFLSPGNGKLYGLTSQGGAENGGVLYEYDMRTDSVHVLYNFGPAHPELSYSGPSAPAGLTQAAPGIFYGIVGSLRQIFKFDANTGVMQLAASVPNFLGGSFNSPQQNGMSGAFFKASDGYLYSTTYAFSQCPIGFPNAGAIARINPADNSLSLVYPFSCDPLSGWNPIGDFVEAGDKLYSNNQWGGAYGAGPTSPGNGTLYEYDPATNIYTKKFDYNGVLGYRPSGGLTVGANGKLYGTTTGGGTPYGVYTNGSGILFEFDPGTGVFTKKYDFNNMINPTVGINPIGTPLVKASSGKLYGKTAAGIYEFDPVSGAVRAAGRYPVSSVPTNPSLIETCRPPAYSYFNDSVFTLCEGSLFRFDLQCDNAASVTWMHNGIPSLTHTSSTLEFTEITAADAGSWQCVLTNSCGSTSPAGLHLIVNPAAPGSLISVISPAGSQSICPGSSIVLSGNTGGTWNTGATSASITVSEPGLYQVTNTNACGFSYSNIIVVDTIPSPAPIVITRPNAFYCYGTNITLSGNTGGTWNNGSTANTITVIADTVTPHYVTFDHTCGTDTSNIILLHNANFYVQDPAPVITTPRVIHICQGQGVWLQSNQPDAPVSGWTWWQIHDTYSSGLGYDQSIYVTTAGRYIIAQNSVCNGILRSDTAFVIVDSILPAVPVITALGPVTICSGTTVTLQSSADNYLWSSGDTTSSITVGTAGAYHVSTSNVCGSTVSADITVTVMPPPAVSWTQTPNAACTGDPVITLSGASPAAGVFSGPGVSGGMFDPAVSGAGVHVLTYSYTDGLGCVGTAVQAIVVTAAPVAPVIYSAIGGTAGSIAICEGDSVQLVAIPISAGLWNTGQLFPVIYAKEAGNYNFTVSNSCGSATSADLVLNVNPRPEATVSQTGAVELTAALNDSYQWMDCGSNTIMTGDTAQIFTPVNDGSYAVIVSDANHCKDTSSCYIVVVTGLDELSADDYISVYPNPAQDKLNIVTSGTVRSVSIVNQIGQQVLATIEKQLNVSSLAKGIYFIIIETDKGMRREKFVKE